MTPRRSLCSERRARLRFRYVHSVLLAAALGACDVPSGAPTSAEPIVVLTAAPSGEVARDVSFELELSGLVTPDSTSLGAAFVWSGGLPTATRLAFDPVRRVLTIDPRSLLDPELDYRLTLEGIEGLDGGAGVPFAMPFRTTRALVGGSASGPSVDEVLAVLDGCTACHGGDEPVLGLDLGSREGLARTALGVPSTEAERFGVGPGLAGLARVEVGHPERSYLVYKMLGEGPIVGLPMGDASTPDEPLPRERIELVSRWIASGAPLE